MDCQSISMDMVWRDDLEELAPFITNEDVEAAALCKYFGLDHQVSGRKRAAAATPATVGRTRTRKAKQRQRKRRTADVLEHAFAVLPDRAWYSEQVGLDDEEIDSKSAEDVAEDVCCGLMVYEVTIESPALLSMERRQAFVAEHTQAFRAWYKVYAGVARSAPHFDYHLELFGYWLKRIMAEHQFNVLQVVTSKPAVLLHRAEAWASATASREIRKRFGMVSWSAPHPRFLDPPDVPFFVVPDSAAREKVYDKLDELGYEGYCDNYGCDNICDPEFSVDNDPDNVGDAYGELWLAQRDEAIWFSGDYFAHKDFD
jgi:hypothetical protein